MNDFTISAVNLHCKIHDLSANLDAHRKWIRQLKDSAIILFPELSLTSYTKDKRWLIKNSGEIQRIIIEMCDFSRDYPETAICFGAPDFENDDIYICHYVVQKGKIIFRHRKTVLGPGERQTYRQAEYAAVFHDMILPDSVNVSIGIQICAETHIPELSAALADQGAEILLMPFASPRESASEKLNRFKRFLPARAYDNSCFTACCNQIWKTEKFGKSPGAALILSPRGIVISESSSGEESYVSGTIDLKEINTIKSSKMGYFRDWVIKSPPGKGKA